MNKTIKKIINISLITLSTGLISSCSNTESKGRAHTCVVNFYDDSKEPVLIGKTQVVPGEAAVFTSLDSNKPYNYQIQGNKSKEPGVKYVFDKWIGYYDDDKKEPIDLTKIEHDCNVKVQFKKEELKYRVCVNNFNKKRDLKDGEKILTMSWGKVFNNLPNDLNISLDSTFDNKGFNPINGHRLYGYSVNNIDITNNKYIKSNTQIKSKFYYGEGNPNKDNVKVYDFNSKNINASNSYSIGSLYEDVLDKSFYIYLNETWNNCGNFNDEIPLIEYDAKFNTEFKDYKVKIYKDKSKTQLIGEIEAKYGSEIKLNYDSENNFNGIINYVNLVGNRSIDLKDKLSQEELKSFKWAGNYEDNDNVDPKYRGKPMDVQKFMVAGDCYLFNKK